MFEDHRGVVGTVGPVADRQQSLAELLDREVLPCLERPGRLLGPFDLPSATVTGKTKLVLVWPSVAEGAHAPAALRPLFVGLPNPRHFSLSLGSVPSPNLGAALRERGLPAFGRPDWTPLADADLWVVWLDCPLQLTGLLSILVASGLHPRSGARTQGPRVVVAGPGARIAGGLASVYADAVWPDLRELDVSAWQALGQAAVAGEDWLAPLRERAETIEGCAAPASGRLSGPVAPALPELQRRDLSVRPDLGVDEAFLRRPSWRESGRRDAFTDHIVVGAGSERLRAGATPALVDEIVASLGRETASLELHFVLGLDSETEGDRLAIAAFTNAIIAAAPRGARQVGISLHELRRRPGCEVRADEFGAERAGRISRVLDHIQTRRVRARVAAPGIGLIDSILAAGPSSAQVLEEVWAAGGYVAEAEAATRHDLWRRALGGDGAGPNGRPGEGAPAPTGLPQSLDVEVPHSVSPAAPRNAVPRSRRPRPGRWTRWRALVPQHFDYRIEYAKSGRLRFLGPSELSDLLLGACERGAIPVCTSGVVQPRPRVGFGPSLPAGIAGDREYLDLSLGAKVDDLHQRLQSQLPEGIRVLATEFMPRSQPAMQLSRIALAEYEAELEPSSHTLPADRDADIARVRQWSHRIDEGLPPEGDAPDDPLRQLRRIHWNQLDDGRSSLEFTLDLRTEGARCKPREVVARALDHLSVDPRLIPLRRRRLFVVDDSSGRARLHTPLEQARLARFRQRALERQWAE